MLTQELLPRIQQTLRSAKIDGWLLYDFRGANSIAGAMLGMHGHVTRRVFAWVPAHGIPIALTHAIEQDRWAHWPKEWGRTVYSSWRSLEAALGPLVSGKRVAMEYSPGDAVPYLDRVPAGVIEMVRTMGGTVVTSGELVSTFYASWTKDDIAAHVRAAEVIAHVAREAFSEAAMHARSGTPTNEYALTRWILDRFARANLITDHGPNVSVGANAANPHYEPTAERAAKITDGSLVLIDLWATEREGVPYADQTWMASIGSPSAQATQVWTAVRDARDAAIDLVTTGIAAGKTLRGADVDDAARNVIVTAGFGEYFTHRTGHSIDARELHGSGPNLDNLESRDERLLIPGVGFSIEPGAYIAGQIGVRSEVNAYIEEGRAVITPREYQRDLFVV